MGGERYVTRLVAATIAVAMVAMPAAAQVTTGTLTGTVKDAQGAVVPGATVTLTSDSRGTQLPDVVSNSSGDFTFVNVAPDVYTIQITMDGFKTLRRGGVPVSAGDRYAIGTLVVEVGGLAETVSVTGETSAIQASSGERSFTVSREAVENLPVASRSYMALAVLSPGVMLDGNQTPVRIGGGGDPNIMMDGVSAMDTGSNRPLLQMNVESIAEVKVLTSGLPGRIRSIERRPGDGHHQERHEPLPRLALRRRTRLRLVLEHQDEQAEQRSQDGPARARLGLFDRRTDR